MVSLDSYPVPNAGVVGRIVDGEAVLVLSEQGQVKVLNEVGARIWTLADGTRTLRDIAAAICAEYDVDPAQAEADVLEFVGQLAERGIVSFSGEPVRP
jgi:hypothetical protein